eukprot:scaffold6689_cov120-Isochrysis_galbana.AAC.2
MMMNRQSWHASPKSSRRHTMISSRTRRSRRSSSSRPSTARTYLASTLTCNKLQDLEGAISAKQAVAGQQRRPMKRSGQLFAGGDLLLLPANEDKTGQGHVIRAVPKWAIERGRAYCALSVCPESAGKASSSSHRHKQAPRAKAGNGVWCMGCEQAYHAGCFARVPRTTAA